MNSFNILREKIIEVCGLKCSQLEKEEESLDYLAGTFRINNKIALYRHAKITPTKNGHFVFPKSALVKKGVFSVSGKGGKRALRVYPPWDKAESTQAAKTQCWQLEYFAEIPKSKSIDIQKFKTLYSVI